MRHLLPSILKGIAITFVGFALVDLASIASASSLNELADVDGFRPGLTFNTASGASPLRAQDRVVIRNGHFYTVGERAAGDSGKRIRFFGVSLALSANFPSNEDGEKLAQHLAALGVNIVRIHAIDQPAQHDPAGPDGVLVDAARPTLDPAAIQTLSRFIAQLGRHGIYVDLNLFVNHTFPATRSGDQIPPQSKPLPIFDVDMMAWQETYAKSLLSALRLKDQPYLALVEINNESTLIDAWQEDTLPQLVKGRFRAELNDQWVAYRASHHIDAMEFPLSRSGLTARDASVAARFFIELDERYIDRMVSLVKDVLGDDVPVSGTQIIHSGRWNHGGFANFDVNRSATFTDAHFYVDHYFFPHRQWDWTDWRISNSWLGDSPTDTLFNTAFARAAQKPFIVSEFNQAWPNEQGSDLLPTLTQFAISQDWDGLILYDYAHDRAWSSATPSDFSLRGDVTKLVQFAQCAGYFRLLQPDTSLAQYTITLSPNDRVVAAANGITGNLARYLLKHFDIEPTVAMRRQIAIGSGPTFDVREATGHASSYFNYDAPSRQFTFGSAYAAGISGYLPADHPVKSSILDVTLAPSPHGFSTVLLTSLDHKPLVASSRLLLTIPGATMGTDQTGPQRLQTVGLRGQWKTIVPKDGDTPSESLYHVPGPAQMERIAATIDIQTTADQASVTPLDLNGAPLHPFDVRMVGGHLKFNVNHAEQPFAVAYEITLQR
ncbi:hypothetical protein LMG29542_07087 [Paraburkholderia humisilvae]|uniref:Glycoside hydrolase family 5 domain-containing protein n=2 Tax=Paraburkholderia humisilvae TaxID=627669 RepID=A0A6J5F7C0_9BURK|nr:hypothetical protein LMG29542_07087 [Paraburkholderia humisilvae]